MSKKTPLIILAIVLLSLAIRFYGLGNVPPSLNWDEVSHGYNAYSLLKTGADEWGNFLPLANFRAYGDYPLPVSLYLIVPVIFVFGLTEFAIRFPTALLGALVVIPEYYLGFQVTKNKKAALLAALLIGIIPWTILPSRGVFQPTIALFFMASALALLLSLRSRPILLPISLLALGISAYSYHNARIVAVLLLPFIAIYLWRYLSRKIKLNKVVLGLSAFFVSVFFIPLVFVLISQGGHARANWVFLVDLGAVNTLNQSRNNSTLPPLLSRIIYNRLTYFFWVGARNYLDYFSPRFLFFQGGTQYQYSLPGWGLIYLTLLPFLYGGLFLSIRKLIKVRDWPTGLNLLLIVLAPIPAAITTGQFHVLRSSLLIPGLLVVTSLALIRFLSLVKHRLIYLLTVLAIFIPIIISLSSYLGNLFSYYPANYSWSWQYGYKQVSEVVKNNYQKYDRVLITKKYGEPHEFLLFFWPWDPGSYKSDPHLVRYFRSDWYWVDSFDKFIFVNDWEIKARQKALTSPGKTLLITSPGNYSFGAKIGTINFLDGQPAFDIISL